MVYLMLRIQRLIFTLLLFLMAALAQATDDEFDSYEADGDSASAYQALDRFESFNRAIFSFNDSADQYLVKPVAKAYRWVMPSFLDEGVTNIFKNLDDVETFANSILQAKFHNAIVTLNRIIYNSVFGLGGFFDVATAFGLENTEEDFGQTLGYWGYEDSTYLMLPIFGPSTVRDLGGRLVDSYSDPLKYIDEIHSDARYLSSGVNLLDQRSDLLGAENILFGDDRYSFIRSAYYQNRAYLINDGIIEDSFSDDEFDYDDF